MLIGHRVVRSESETLLPVRPGFGLTAHPEEPPIREHVREVGVVVVRLGVALVRGIARELAACSTLASKSPSRATGEARRMSGSRRVASTAKACP